MENVRVSPLKPVLAATCRGWFSRRLARSLKMPRRRRSSMQSHSPSCSISEDEGQTIFRKGRPLISINGSPIPQTVLLAEKTADDRTPQVQMIRNGHTPLVVHTSPSNHSSMSLKRRQCNRCNCQTELILDDNRPLVDRFADDTSMLGFRYLHSRYKTWFRILWSILLIFFFALTIYQVAERVSYYFIINPLITTRFYNTPSEVEFPKIVICNKMQIKASKVAEVNPRLLSALSESFDDEQHYTTNDTIRHMLTDFNAINSFEFFVNTKQNVEDLFVGCQFGKGKNCIDNVKPILTPNGLCFLVDMNTTVRRPGPESTLQLLLNLEIYESVPGWVTEPGVVLSMFDANVPFVNHFQEGMHLEPGKAVTIPINDIRRLQRHSSQCGSDAKLQNIFPPKDYSKSACQWLAKIKDVRDRCKCEPILSPRNRDMFQNTTGSKQYADPEGTPNLANGRKGHSEYPICTIAEEVFCVQNVLEEPLSPKTQKFLLSCINDCDDVSFTTIVFGNDLHSSDISHYLPGDWEGEKEKRLAHFQLALENLPKNRISLVRHIQKIADDAKHFLNESMRIFGIKKESGDELFPCFNTSEGFYHEGVYAFHRKETLWDGMKEFLETEFPKHFAKSLKLFNLEIDQHLRLRDDYDSSEKSEETYLTMATEALYYLRVFENQVTGGGSIPGLDSIQATERVAVNRHLSHFLHELQDCVVKIQFNPPEQARNLTKPCRKMMLSYHAVLLNARTVAKTISTDALKDFDTGVKGLTAVLRKLKYDIPGSIFTIDNYNVDLRMFRKLYKEGGQGNELLVELLRFRKFIQSGAVDEIKKFVEAVELAVEARNSVVKELDLTAKNMSIQPMKFAQETAKCMGKMVDEIDVIRKSPMIRAELMSRIIHAVTVAQSYSPGPEYDRVNLLFLKIYFAHFKEEMITQERSYNVFLLLAEIGGTIGLYVGAALLSVAETVVFFFEKHTLKDPMIKHPA